MELVLEAYLSEDLSRPSFMVHNGEMGWEAVSAEEWKDVWEERVMVPDSSRLFLLLRFFFPIALFSGADAEQS